MTPQKNLRCQLHIACFYLFTSESEILLNLLILFYESHRTIANLASLNALVQLLSLIILDKGIGNRG